MRGGPCQVTDHERAAPGDQAGHRRERGLGVRDMVDDRVGDYTFETGLTEITQQCFRVALLATDARGTIRPPRC